MLLSKFFKHKPFNIISKSRYFSTSKQQQKMNRVISYDQGNYEYQTNIDASDMFNLKPEEILVEVPYVGICAGDTKCYLGAPLFHSPDKKGNTYFQKGCIPGHEFCGTVVELGSSAKELYNINIGDKAIAEQIIPCNICHMCLSGDYNVCHPWNDKHKYRSAHEIYGFRNEYPGGMSTYMKYKKNSRIHKIPNDMNLRDAVFIEPLSCAIHAVNRADIQLNDVVIISGAGAIGCGAICAAKLKNPKCIIALDLIDFKLDVAKQCGADIVLNPLKHDIYDTVMSITDEYGANKYIEATGAGPSVTQGIDLLRRRGIFVEYSVFKDDVLVNMTRISDEKQLDIRGGHLGPHCYPIAIDMISNGCVPIDKIITHEYPMSDFLKGFATVDREILKSKQFIEKYGNDKFEPGDSIKVILNTKE